MGNYWEAYWATASSNPLDWFIVILGLVLVVAHMIGLRGHWVGKHVLFVQDLDRYRVGWLSMVELLPLLGLLGTTFSLMLTFKTFQIGAQGEAPDLSQMVAAFAPAMSTTISGLGMTVVNLFFNSVLHWLCPRVEKGEGLP